jgi:Outer membrane protein beta-barrel domain
MSKSVRILAAALLFAGAAAATDWQQYEVYLGYDFVRFNPNSGFIPSFNANGGGGQFVYNFNKWIGAAVDLSGVTKGTLNGFGVDTTVASFTAGPRFTWNHGGRWVPYGQVLFGGAYATTSTAIGVLPLVDGAVLPPGIILPPGVPFSGRLGASNTGFAMLAGGGLDIKISKHVYFRPFEASYFLTRIPSFLTNGNTTNRNNFRYSGGVNFMFGGPR